MGVGSPDDLLMAIGEGVDLFDCTLPTRMARAGSLLTRPAGATCATPASAPRGPPDPDCACAVCARYSAATLHWLFQEDTPWAGASRPITTCAFLCALLRDARIAIMEGATRPFAPPSFATWVAADPP